MPEFSVRCEKRSRRMEFIRFFRRLRDYFRSDVLPSGYRHRAWAPICLTDDHQIPFSIQQRSVSMPPHIVIQLHGRIDWQPLPAFTFKYPRSGGPDDSSISGRENLFHEVIAELDIHL